MKEIFDKDIISKSIIDSAKESFQAMKTPPMTNDPVIVESEIIEYQGRLRVIGVDKFKAPCYIVASSFYNDETNKENEKNACGTLIICIKEDQAIRLLNGLGQSDFDEDDPEAMMTECDALLDNYAKKLLSALSRSGYKSLIRADSVRDKNSIPEGVDFPSKQYHFVEVQFELWREMCLTIAAVFDPSAK